MKTSLKSILWRSHLIGLFGVCTQCSIAQTPEEQVKQELFKLEQALNVGVMMHDTSALKKILADEYQLSGPRFPGGLQRSQWLANCLKISSDSVTITDVTLSNWGEVAVFRSLQHFYNAVLPPGPQMANPGPYFDSWITDLWIKRKERWQLVTRLSERVAKK
jgi:hypothetical protein